MSLKKPLGSIQAVFLDGEYLNPNVAIAKDNVL
jgi:hypothetical protein